MSTEPAPVITEEAISDLNDLREAIAQLMFVFEMGADAETVGAHYRETLHLVETTALFHCGITEKIIRNNKQIIRASGWRQISVPADWDGPWYVNSPEAKKP